MITWLGIALANHLVVAAALEEPNTLQRALKILQRRAPIHQVAWAGRGRRCITSEEPIRTRLRRRIERITAMGLEERQSCEIASYPLGAGWVVTLIEPPAHDLEALIEPLQLGYEGISRPSPDEVGRPVRLCTHGAPTTSWEHVKSTLTEGGLEVLSVWQVGSCFPQIAPDRRPRY